MTEEPGAPPAGGAAESAGAVRAMLEARTVAVVGASRRPQSFGDRVVRELGSSPCRPEIHLVNPGYREIGGRPCVPSLADVPAPVDLVLMAVRDELLEAQIDLAAARGDRGAVVFGGAWDPCGALRTRIAARARSAGMALCGGGCMGFVNVVHGLRAIGYLEHDPLPAGPVALVTHSGSAFSALLRADRRLGWSIAVSSGQELVTTTADYLDYALSLPETRVVALLVETLREPARLLGTLVRAAEADVPVVLLTVGGSRNGRELVAAHSGAIAGDDAAWEALSERAGLVRVGGLDELADCLELFAAGRRATGAGLGLATVHDSGAERALAADVGAALGVRFAPLSPATGSTLAALLDPGLEVANPLDVWGRGADTRELFAAALAALAADPGVGAVALAVDLVPELDGDESYRLAIADAFGELALPVALLANLPSALDREAARRLRSLGIPVLEGTRSGLLALRALLERPEVRSRVLRPRPAPRIDEDRRRRWVAHLDRAAGEPLPAADAFALLADYGIGSVPVLAAGTRGAAMDAARKVGFPCVLKTDERGVAHKSDRGGVVLGLSSAREVAAAYDRTAATLGPRVVVSPMAADGVELLLGMTHDPLLGPLVVAGAGGVLVELLRDRRLALPPLDVGDARRLVDGLRARPLLGGLRGAPASDVDAVVRAAVAVSDLAVELGGVLSAVEVNPLRCGPYGAIALDALVLPRSR